MWKKRAENSFKLPVPLNTLNGFFLLPELSAHMFPWEAACQPVRSKYGKV